MLGRHFEESRLVNSSALFPDQGWEFLARNLALGTLVTTGALRYFYVTDQWRANIERAAHSRISALQARIRPHFLFNSMNTIAALTRSDPVAAEQAVEDLADLFRASLSNPGESIPLEQELEVARVYQRMEEQRLGSRLKVTWDIDQLPMATRIPSLTIQPLLENAIYHGVEQLPAGGEITIRGQMDNQIVTIVVTNPTPADSAGRAGGNQLALDNIRQRLALAYGKRARLEVQRSADSFRVLIGFPQVA
jgi:two-component system sensor histidine kinase AlgZ